MTAVAAETPVRRTVATAVLLSVVALARTTAVAASGEGHDDSVNGLDLGGSVDPYIESIPIVLVEETGVDTGLDRLGSETLASVYSTSMDVLVDENCNYEFTFEFTPPDGLPMGPQGFTGVCDGTVDNIAANGEPYHSQTQYWQMVSPEPIHQATGLEHIAIQWKPCGDHPSFMRQPRWDVVFYRVLPVYRTVMECPADELRPNRYPLICDTPQDTPRGRAMFAVPTGWDSTSGRILGMPDNFQPGRQAQGVPYDGLLCYDKDTIPQSFEDFTRPIHKMSTFDGDVVSSRWILPHRSFSDPGGSGTYNGQVSYIVPTSKRMPTSWTVVYNQNFDGKIKIVLRGESGLCKDDYDAAVAASSN